MHRFFKRTVLGAAAVALMTTAPVAAQVRPVVSLKVSKETAPPGGMAQMKVFITEPQPISTGGGTLKFDAFGRIEGIALVTPGSHTYGVAVVNGTSIDLSILSPNATFAMISDDYPVVTIAGFVRRTTPIGTTFPLTFDSLWLADASGSAYVTDVKPGYLIAQPGLSIHDVKPGSADLPAGAVVSIFGSSFEPRTTVKFAESKLAAVRFVSSSRIDVVLAQPTRMHGTEIMALNPDGSHVEYFSYERTSRADASAHPLFALTVPVFPFERFNRAAVAVAGTQTALALQNLDTRDARVTAELVRVDGVLLATRVVTVKPGRFILQELSEMIGPYADAATVCVRASSAVQVMGIALDAGVARPLIPSVAVPSVCE
jgi:hypothetical protein